MSRSKAERVITAAAAITVAGVSGPVGAAIAAAITDYALQQLDKRNEKKGKK